MKPSDLHAVIGARFSACEVARTLAWMNVQSYPEHRTREETVTALQSFEDETRHTREEFERAVPKRKP